MSAPSAFAASVLDSSLPALSAGVALCLRGPPAARKAAAPGTFEEQRADLRVRLQYLAESVALGRASVYLQHVEWLRGAYVARGLGEDSLRATHACLASVLRESLPPPAWAALEPVLACEAELLAAPWSEPPSALEGARGAEAARLLEAVLRGRRADSIALALELADRLGVEEFVEHVLVAVQRELGRLWQRGEIHVGEEHLASRVTEEILARLAARDERAPGAGRVLVASTSGDLHEIGARMVAFRFARAGFDVCFLGANVPRADLALSLRDFAPHVLALSVTLGLHLRGAAAIVESAHALVPRVPVLVGGSAFAFDPELWRTIGADAVATDAASAERAARALAGT